MKILNLAFLIMLFSYASMALAESKTSSLSKERKTFLTNLAAVSGVAAYGFINWDYGDSGFQSSSEGWFSKNTKEGGSDKLGHFYTGYSVSRSIYPIYLKWGYTKEEAIKQSFLTSFILTTAMEIGDGFSSEFGFSHEDFVANSIGQLGAYILDTHPKIDKILDFRMEYNFSKGATSDPLTDYESTKYLAVLKMSGVEQFYLDQGFSRYLEFHLGYYVRGFENQIRHDDQRNIYVGVGINLAQILYDLSYKKTSKIFNYYQTPYTYLEARKNFNR